jgi:TrmH family RNA methyltransferase
MFETITSVQNPRIKNLVRLREHSHRRRQSRFLVEGHREIERAAATGWPLESLFFCEELLKSPASWELVHHLEERSVEVIRLGHQAFAKCAYRQGPDGLLAVARQSHTRLEDLPLGPAPLIVVLEAVEKPGNIGAVFRSANAAGAEALVLTESLTDPYNPNVIRASQGAFFHLPFVRTDNVHLLDFFESRRILPVALSPGGQKTLWEADLRGPVALILGTEKTGLSSDWMEAAQSFRLPMRGVTDSLNVAATAAVAVFEAIRQRTGNHSPA